MSLKMHDIVQNSECTIIICPVLYAILFRFWFIFQSVLRFFYMDQKAKLRSTACYIPITHCNFMALLANVWRFPEGSGKQERVERYCCNIIRGAPTTSNVKGLR